MVKIELLTLSLDDLQMGDVEIDEMMMIGENQSSQSHVHVTAFWGTEG
jgi:hypothetical protein